MIEDLVRRINDSNQLVSLRSTVKMGRDSILVFSLFVTCSMFVPSWADCRIIQENGRIIWKCTCSKDKIFTGIAPKNATHIIMRDCKIPDLRQLVAPCSKLKGLDIRNNVEITIEINTFDNNLELEMLRIGYCRVNISMLTKALCHMTVVNRLRILQLNFLRINASYWPDMLYCINNMLLVHLDISNNPIGPLLDPTINIPSLEVLYVSGIYPIQMTAFVNLVNLKILYLSNCHLTKFPNFYHTDTNDTMFPGLTELYLDRNEISSLPESPVGLSQLEKLTLDHNRIRSITTQFLTVSPKLTNLTANHNTELLLSKINFHTSLVELSLNFCGLQFTWYRRNIFKHSTNMRNLQLGGNFFKSHYKNVLEIIFRGMTRLQHIRLDNCSLTSLVLSDYTFKGLDKLEHLELSFNKITVLSPEFFKNLPSISSLYLAANRITEVSSDVLSSFSHSLTKLDMSGNPFMCNCSLLSFMELYRRMTIKMMTKGGYSYRCHDPESLRNVKLSSFNMIADDCSDEALWVAIGTSLCSSLVVIVVVISLVYRYRWHIGYLYFLMRAKRREAREVLDDTTYVYDAFVVYNGTDVGWVKDELLPAMEEDAEFTLCVHDRDWLLGRDIVDNIVQSIESSRKTLLVVSNAFAISQWCQLELTLAQHRLLEEDRNAMILVLLEPLKRENITPRLLLQMKRQTYMEWTEDPVGQKLFWKKLRRALQKPVGSLVHGSIVQPQNVPMEGEEQVTM